MIFDIDLQYETNIFGDNILTIALNVSLQQFKINKKRFFYVKKIFFSNKFLLVKVIAIILLTIVRVHRKLTQSLS